MTAPGPGHPFYDVQIYVQSLDISEAQKTALTVLIKNAVRYAAGDRWSS